MAGPAGGRVRFARSKLSRVRCRSDHVLDDLNFFGKPRQALSAPGGEEGEGLQIPPAEFLASLGLRGWSFFEIWDTICLYRHGVIGAGL